jgi:hypothetical protein
MGTGIKPIVQAILVADHVYTDAGTGKKIVTGIFHSIFTRKQAVRIEQVGEGSERRQLKVPISAAGFQMGSPFAYISLANVRGKQQFSLRYVDLSTDEARFQAEFGVDCKDPLATVELAVPLPPLPADKPATFALELVWNDEPLGSYRIQVQFLEEPPPGSGTTDDSPSDEQ